MKRHLTLLALLLNTLMQAQNWKPIQSGDTYLYYLQGHGFDSTAVCIKAEQTTTQNSDSLVTLNRTLHPIGSGYYQRSSDFFRDQITYRADGSFRCSGPGEMVFIPYYPINIPWICDTLNALTATIVQKNLSVVFGTADSTLSISVSNGDSYVLSQNYGVLTVCRNNVCHNLAGIKGRGVGIQIPDVYSMLFTIQPGDVLEYYNVAQSYAWPSYSPFNYSRYQWAHDSLLSKSISNDTLYLRFHRTYADSFLEVTGLHTYWDSCRLTRWYYVGSVAGSMPATNPLNNMVGYNSPGPGFAAGAMSLSNLIGFDSSSTFGCRTIAYRNLYIDSAAYTGGDTLSFMDHYETPWAPSEQSRAWQVMGDSVGVIYAEYQSMGNPMGGFRDTKELIYSRINGIERGTVMLHVGLNEPLRNKPLKVYPNPTDGVVFVADATQDAQTCIVRDVTGRSCLVTEVNAQGAIDLSSLTPGVYLIEFTNGATVKVIRQ